MEGDVEGVMRRPPADAPDTEETRAERDKWYDIRQAFYLPVLPHTKSFSSPPKEADLRGY